MGVETTGDRRKPTRIGVTVTAVVVAVAFTAAVGGGGSARVHPQIAPVAGLGIAAQGDAGAAPGRAHAVRAKPVVLTPQAGHSGLVDRGNDFFAWHEHGSDGVAFG